MIRKTFYTFTRDEFEILTLEQFGIQMEFNLDEIRTYEVCQEDIDEFDYQTWAQFLEQSVRNEILREYTPYIVLVRLVMLDVLPMGFYLIYFDE